MAIATSEAAPDDDNSGRPTSREILALVVYPREIELSEGNRAQRIVVIAECADGVRRDVTKRCDLKFLEPDVARLDETNRVMIAGSGETTLQAQIDGREAKSTVRVEAASAATPVTFQRDIVRVLTKRGCNSSSCHGGVIGRGGFKLSLDAIDSKEDYQWIVKGGGYQVLSPIALEPIESRIDLKQPEQSLLLLKPTDTEPHEGGQRFEEDSEDYRSLLQWIRSGAPYEADDPDTRARVERIDVFPRIAVLDGNGTHQILVKAHWSNGQSEDITDHVRYEALRPDVVDVSEDGLVKAGQVGTATVLIRSVGHVSSAQFRVSENPQPNPERVESVNFIDDHVFAKLRDFQIVPSQPSSDLEFLRRVCLDLTGTLPPPEAVRNYVADTDLAKRGKLIDSLLDSPEFDEFWTFRLADLFRVGGEYGWVHLYWEWVRSSVARNKPYDRMAREIIAAQGYTGPSRVLIFGDNKPEPVERIVAGQFRLFMGRRLDCAECHNHAFDRWSQNQFWGLAAFYGRLTTTKFTNDVVVFDDVDGHEIDFGARSKSVAFRKVIHPRSKQKVTPRFPDGRALPDDAAGDPRAALADWMTSHQYFSEAAANRIWGYFFGRGIVDPVDDFRTTNPPSHPELLSALANDFVEHDFDLKHLMRRIVRSRTYQLSNKPNDSNRHDTMNYSRALPRRLEAEVLLDAITSVTGISDTLHGTGVIKGTAPAGTRAINLKMPASYSSRFLEAYGRPLRQTLPERDDRANLIQALHMLVGSTYTEKLVKEEGRIHRLLSGGATNRVVIDELYLAALTRLGSIRPNSCRKRDFRLSV